MTSSKKRSRRITFGILAALISLNTFGYEGSGVRSIEDSLTRQGITEDYTESSLHVLEHHLTSKIAFYKRKGKKPGIKKGDKKDIDQKLNYYNYALALLDFENLLPFQIMQNYTNARRIAFNVRALVEIKNQPIIKSFIMIPFQLHTNIDYILPKHKFTRLGELQAPKESKNLLSKRNPGTFATPAELSILTYNEVAGLDIADNHPFLYSQRKLDTIENPFRLMEDEAQKIATHYLTKDIEKPYSDNFKYDLKKASRFLFFDEFKNSATSAKIKTKDPHNLKWKMKWGVETQTDPVAARIFARAGVKYVDLTYSKQSSKNPTTLILAERRTMSVIERKKELKSIGQTDSKACDHVDSVDLLVRCMRKGYYRFTLLPFIVERGTITKENKKQVLRNYPNYRNKKYKPKKLINREYVVFNEVMVEYKGKGPYLQRNTPVTFGRMGSKNDRAARSSALLNLFIDNVDNKTLNNRSVLYRGYGKEAGNKDFDYFETTHDLGASLGTAKLGGLINKIGQGSRFLEPLKAKENSIHTKLRYHGWLLFRPTSWKKSSYSDLLWMAKRIVKIKVPEFEEIIAASSWPDFMQKAFVFRLLGRRNYIAKLFGIENLLDQKVIKRPDFQVDLSTHELRVKAAKQYHLDVNDIETAMKNAELLGKTYIDKLVVHGSVSRCKKTILIGLLEDKLFPSGLSRRIFRFSDHRKLRVCKYKQ
ncbi:MAG: hypothetical protein HOE90_17245 [Bacteriovoracaceae bacterium]|nr:hypothetical protein [Bacteriovoracaceae bacterium]